MTNTPDTIAIVRTGTANIASVAAALSRLNVDTTLVTRPTELDAVTRLVLPGVGSFGAAMTALEEQGLVDPIRNWINAGRPFLGICVGMQILCACSDESPGIEGLGVIPATVRRFGPTVDRVPQLGWNQVVAPSNAQLASSGYGYFANSFRIAEQPEDWIPSITTHGETFVSLLEREGQLACQCHPELSGSWGSQLLSRWVTQTSEVLSC